MCGSLAIWDQNCSRIPGYKQCPHGFANMLPVHGTLAVMVRLCSLRMRAFGLSVFEIVPAQWLAHTFAEAHVLQSWSTLVKGTTTLSASAEKCQTKCQIWHFGTFGIFKSSFENVLQSWSTLVKGITALSVSIRKCQKSAKFGILAYLAFSNQVL